MNKTTILLTILTVTSCTKEEICFPDFQDCPGEETGGEEVELPDGTLTCEPTIQDVDWVPPQWCHVGWQPLEAGPWESREAVDCETRHPAIPCNGGWSGYFSDECVLCTPGTHEEDSPYGQKLAEDVDGWKICRPYGHGDDGIIHPATYLPSDWSDGDTWVDDIACAGEGSVGSCGLGFAAIDEPDQLNWGDEDVPPGAEYWSLIDRSTWTCLCNADDPNDGSGDSWCQPGAVCEGGWVDNGNGWFEPSLCTILDADGSVNGIAPQGPIVYGLDSWAAGLAVEGNVITVTETALRAALDGGLWNDDQRFRQSGEFAYCGDEALCSLFGIVVGDVIDPADSFLDALAGEGWAVIEVDHPNGSTSAYTLVVVPAL